MPNIFMDDLRSRIDAEAFGKTGSLYGQIPAGAGTGSTLPKATDFLDLLAGLRLVARNYGNLIDQDTKLINDYIDRMVASDQTF